MSKFLKGVEVFEDGLPTSAFFIPCQIGSSEPGVDTEGAQGCLYMDQRGNLYKNVSSDISQGYVWERIENNSFFLSAETAEELGEKFITLSLKAEIRTGLELYFLTPENEMMSTFLRVYDSCNRLFDGGTERPHLDFDFVDNSGEILNTLNFPRNCFVKVLLDCSTTTSNDRYKAFLQNSGLSKQLEDKISQALVYGPQSLTVDQQNQVKQNLGININSETEVENIVKTTTTDILKDYQLIEENEGEVTSHAENKTNPHEVTRTQIKAAPSGFGLGEIEYSDIEDCNELTQNGWFKVRGTVLNRPTWYDDNTDDCVIFVMGDGSITYQVGFRSTPDIETDNPLLTRACYEDVDWTSWREIIDENNLSGWLNEYPTLSDLEESLMNFATKDEVEELENELTNAYHRSAYVVKGNSYNSEDPDQQLKFYQDGEYLSDFDNMMAHWYITVDGFDVLYEYEGSLYPWIRCSEEEIIFEITRPSDEDGTSTVYTNYFVINNSKGCYFAETLPADITPGQIGAADGQAFYIELSEENGILHADYLPATILEVVDTNVSAYLKVEGNLLPCVFLNGDIAKFYDMSTHSVYSISNEDGTVTVETMSPPSDSLIVTMIEDGTTNYTAAEIYNFISQGKTVYLFAYGNLYIRCSSCSLTEARFEDSYVSTITATNGASYNVQHFRIFTIANNKASLNELYNPGQEYINAQIGSIESVLDNIIAIQEQLIGGDGE